MPYRLPGSIHGIEVGYGRRMLPTFAATCGRACYMRATTGVIPHNVDCRCYLKHFFLDLKLKIDNANAGAALDSPASRSRQLDVLYRVASKKGGDGDVPPPVNWAAGGTMAMPSGSQERWGIPDGTITWEGLPNVR